MIPLGLRSHYSLQWGTSSPEDVVCAAKRLGYTQLAITDTDGLYGLWPYLAACEEEGVTPLVGAEITDPATSRRAICLAENDEGYRSLCRLLSRRHCEEGFSLLNALPDHSTGLIALTSDAQLLTAWHERAVHVAGAAYRAPNGNSLELHRLTRRLGVPLVASPGAFFAPGDHELHRLLRAISLNTSLSRLKAGDIAPADAWLASPEEYARRFAIWPEALRVTHELAERCTFRTPPTDAVLPPWHDPEGKTPADRLRMAACDGARLRYGMHLPAAVVERLEYELGIIAAKGFSSYFLVVQNIVARSPRICGRGSGAASLVAFCLGITNVCPLKYGLYFERFLNPGRIDPPDLDIDFAWDERLPLILSVLQQHGGHAAMVATHILFQPRLALREVAKVWGMPSAEIARTSRRLPWCWREEVESDEDLEERLRSLPALQSLDVPEPWPRILRLAQRLVGIPHHLAVHVGGVVITPRPVDEYVPIQLAPSGAFVIQWEKEGAEKGGLQKIDLLGNRSLAVIRDAIANLRENGILLDDLHWNPEDDEATQQAVAAGRTMGCYYVESPAMRQLLKKTGAGDYPHLVILSSIIRPAANAYIREYVRRYKGGAWKPLHPLLEDTLSETLGIMVYQEDVSRVAVALAGFTHAEADGLRKILSKKDRVKTLLDCRERFAAGARQRGVSDAVIEQVWDGMMSFQGYSFCKAHSASYARVSYQAAFLKVHHPAAFMAAVISNFGGYYSTFAYVSEARRIGLKVLPPDVNDSAIRWVGKDRSLRVGLLSIKGLGEATQQRIISARGDRLFTSIEDFVDRVGPAEDEVRALLDCGAFDALESGLDRAILRWRWKAVSTSLITAKRKQPSLLEIQRAIVPRACPPIPPGTERERLRQEFRVLGFLCDRHPMVLYAGEVQKARSIKAVDLPGFVGQQVRFAGWLITGKLVTTKRNEPMEFLTFEDDTALVEATFFPPAYRRFCDHLDYGRPYLLTGKVEEDFGAATLTVSDARLLATGS